MFAKIKVRYHNDNDDWHYIDNVAKVICQDDAEDKEKRLMLEAKDGSNIGYYVIDNKYSELDNEGQEYHTNEAYLMNDAGKTIEKISA